MKAKLLLSLALVLGGILAGCSTPNQGAGWPVFYDSEKGPEQLSVSHEPKPLDAYTNGIPEINYDLLVPTAKIKSAKVTELGKVNGLRAMEAQLCLIDAYYSDAILILQEVKPHQFLPVYVQDYNQNVRAPSENKISREKRKITIETGMDYSGTGHFHHRYKIVIAADHIPEVATVTP